MINRPHYLRAQGTASVHTKRQGLGSKGRES